MNPIDVPTTYRENTKMTTTVNGATDMNLIQEALSRARMRLPQAGTTTRTEATHTSRSARSVAMKARRETARQLGGW